MKPFEVSRLRLERAKEHGAALARIWNEIPKGSLELNVTASVSTGNGIIEVTNSHRIPDEWPLLLGEQLYQLRSALDACVYQAAVFSTGQNPPPLEGRREFPICSDAKEFRRQAKRRLFDLPVEIQDGIERIQPYHAPPFVIPLDPSNNINRYLGILHELARKDRHRKLHVVGAWPYYFTPEFVLPPGVTVHNLEIMPPGILEAGAVLATFQLRGYIAGMDIKVNPRLRILINCDEPPAPIDANDTFAQRLVGMINAVNSVITAFEGYF